jgi:hypothetical protein
MSSGWITSPSLRGTDRWTQTELAFTLAKNATKPNPFEIISLQTTRKENNWKTKETLARTVVTLEAECIKGCSPWCLWQWWSLYISGLCYRHVLKYCPSWIQPKKINKTEIHLPSDQQLVDKICNTIWQTFLFNSTLNLYHTETGDLNPQYYGAGRENLNVGFNL